MKKVFILLCALSFLNACKKENTLEGIQLINLFDQELVDIITLENVIPISCDVIRADLKVYEDRIPDTVIYTHIIVRDQVGNAIRFSETKSLYFISSCDGFTTYELTLYNSKTRKESKPSQFIYIP
jgi:hypothetical protein